MLRFIGKVAGFLIGAILIGPIVGIFTAFFYSKEFYINPVFTAAILIGAFLFTATSLPLVLIPVACGLALVANWMLDKESKAKNSKNFNQRLKELNTKIADENKKNNSDKKLTKKDIDLLIHGKPCDKGGNPCTHGNPCDAEELCNRDNDPNAFINSATATPIYLGMYYGFKAANYISKIISFSDRCQESPEGRIYNIKNGLTQEILLQTNGFGNPKWSEPDPRPAAPKPPATAATATNATAAPTPPAATAALNAGSVPFVPAPVPPAPAPAPGPIGGVVPASKPTPKPKAGRRSSP